MKEHPDGYLELPVIQGDPTNPGPFDWTAWYGNIGGRSSPLPDAQAIMDRIYQDQYQRFDGPTADTRQDLGTPADAASWVKARALLHGADIVGIARVEPGDLYANRTTQHPVAIVVGQRMQYEAFTTVPSQNAAVECLRVYETLGETVIALANDLRGAGWPSTIEHPLGDSSVLHVPLAIKAGFGELGRHGSIIHPEFGPLFRIGSVLTSLPLEPDAPIDAGIGAFCDRCQACRIFCPADAIPDERSPEAGSDPQGNPRYLVDTGKCFPYFARRHYCSACLAVCAYKHKEWARSRDNAPAPYPEVPFGNVPAAADPQGAHHYPRLRRSEPSPYHRDR